MSRPLVVTFFLMLTGGRTPDVQSERRTYADIMTEQKLRAQKVGPYWGPYWIHTGVHTGVHPGSILGSMLGQTGVHTGSSSIHTGSNWRPYWIRTGLHAGSILGSSWGQEITPSTTQSHIVKIVCLDLSGLEMTLNLITLSSNYPILAGIAPPTIRREAAVLALTRKAAKDEDHILHLVISERPSPARLKSRRPFAEHAHRLLRSTPEAVSSRSWLSTRWNEEWRAAEHSRLHSFINTPDHVPGQDLPRRQWTTYNRIRTGVGRFGEAMKRWGLKSTSECECGAPNQSVQHIMDDCTMHRPPNGDRGLTDLDEDTRIWLASTSLEI